MAEGWKQIIDDLRGALGLPRPHPPAPSSEITRSEQISGEGERKREGVRRAEQLETVSVEVREPAPDGEDIPAGPVAAEVSVESETASEAKAITPRQKLTSYLGVGAALVAALGIGWYVYFGGPQPPAPNVVATFEGGQITVEQVHEHVTRLGLDPLVHATGQISNTQVPAEMVYGTYRATVEHMVLDELVRRWAAKQQLDRDTKFTDAMRHASESVTLDDWIAEIHQGEMTSAVRESDIQAYYEANKPSFGNATLSEVRDKIRETLAHQNQTQFFEDYLARLRANASILREDELLAVPAPTEAQIQQAYEANRAQYATPQRALVDRITVPITGTNTEAETQAQRRAEAALAALNAGQDFAQVAARYSQEPYSPAGITLEAGRDDPALVEQALALQSKGDLSPIIRTKTGYAVLRLRERQPARTLSLDEARPQIVAALRAENESAWFKQNADRTLLTIQGERYTLGQFYHEYQNLPPGSQKKYAGPEGLRQLADLVIDRWLVLNDAYDRLLDQKNAPLLDEIRASVLRQMMHQAEVDPQVAVTDQQARDYYDQHRELFLAPPEARIRSIRLYLGQTKDDQDRAWARADAAYQQLAPGIGGQPADFDAVAKEYDETEKNPAEAGLGEWIRMGDDVLQNLPAHPLHQYILNLPVNSVSRPFAFGNNLYIVKVLERTQPVPLEFDQVKDHLRIDLEAQQHDQLDAELTTRLMREANVTLYDQVIAKMLETDRATPPAP